MSTEIKFDIEDRHVFCMLWEGNGERNCQIKMGDVTLLFHSAWAAESFGREVLRAVEEARESNKADERRRLASIELDRVVAANKAAKLEAAIKFDSLTDPEVNALPDEAITVTCCHCGQVDTCDIKDAIARSYLATEPDTSYYCAECVLIED